MDTTTSAPVNGAALGPPGRRTVLDDAHVGDIRGALGTLRQHAHLPRSRRRRLLALLAIMGPGLIVMVGDNDAGGVATYAQAGQNYRLTLLWTLILLDPGADRQPGDGRPPRRRHRRRARPADHRAVREVLGSVLGRGPVHPELPDDRDRVHRRQPRTGFLRCQQVRRGPGGRRGVDRDGRDRAASAAGSGSCSCS